MRKEQFPLDNLGREKCLQSFRFQQRQHQEAR